MQKKIIDIERSFNMIYSHEVEMMCPVAQGANHRKSALKELDKQYELRDRQVEAFVLG